MRSYALTALASQPNAAAQTAPQVAQEPVAWLFVTEENACLVTHISLDKPIGDTWQRWPIIRIDPLYKYGRAAPIAAPAPLTDEQMIELADMLPKVGEPESQWTMIRTSLARAILRAASPTAPSQGADP